MRDIIRAIYEAVNQQQCIIFHLLGIVTDGTGLNWVNVYSEL